MATERGVGTRGCRDARYPGRLTRGCLSRAGSVSATVSVWFAACRWPASWVCFAASPPRRRGEARLGAALVCRHQRRCVAGGVQGCSEGLCRVPGPPTAVSRGDACMWRHVYQDTANCRIKRRAPAPPAGPQGACAASAQALALINAN